MSGMYAIVKLREMGLTHRVFERGKDVGGTWYWNRYPGARCDVQSTDYSYSFSPELEQEWSWSEKYATQTEILRYLDHVADRFDLRRSITFNCEVTAARWNEDDKRWTIETNQGETLDARFLMLATGALSKPNAADLPGTGRFRGPVYHTGSWPHESIDFTGQRVAVVGTGSSGIQSIPMIAAQAKSLFVFQRTPVYAMPAFNRPLDAEEVASRKRQAPERRRLNRKASFGVHAPDPLPSALDAPVEQRNALYEQRWQDGELSALVGTYADLLVDPAANETLAEFVRDKIRDIVEDPATAELLCPTSFPIGTKRPCLATGYYETFNQPHVRLIDLLTTPIEEATPTGLRIAGGEEIELEAIVLATGFDAVSGSFLAVPIVGRDDRTLRDKWQDGPESFLGLMVEGFPNLFTITGPLSPSVFSNMVVSIEQHVDLAMALIAEAHGRGASVVEPQREAERSWVERVAAIGSATLFPRANSWYMGANIPGKPRVLLAYIGGVGAYREECDSFVARDFEGLTFA